MSILRSTLGAALVSTTLAFSQSSAALDIVLTNDDGFESALTYAVYQGLQAAGHRVLISASTADQSGRGGSVDFLRPIAPLTTPTRGGCLVPSATQSLPGVGSLDSVDSALRDPGCPADPNLFWVSGTPVASSLFGIDVAAQSRFGKRPDLVISGPNFGNNTGLINNSSGTVNAALIAINRGIPAIAVSVADPTTYRSFRTGMQPVDSEIASIVVRLVGELEDDAEHRRSASSLLPTGIGLNVNVPKFAVGSVASLPFRLSEVGTAASVTPIFLTDLCADATTKAVLGAVCASATPPKLAGVSIVPNGAAFPAGLSSVNDRDPGSEQNVVNAGAIAVSVIEGNHEAIRAVQQRVARSLRGLFD